MPGRISQIFMKSIPAKHEHALALKNKYITVTFTTYKQASLLDYAECLNRNLLVIMMRIMRSKEGDGRGRPRRPWHSAYDKQLFAYVIGISQKHGVNPDRFLKKIADAKENEKSTCKTLTIQCRERAKDYSLYRITKKGSLVSQLRIPNYFLEEGFKGCQA